MDNLDYILITLDGEEPIEFECEPIEFECFILASFYLQRMARDYDSTTLAKKLMRVL